MTDPIGDADSELPRALDVTFMRIVRARSAFLRRFYGEPLGLSATQMIVMFIAGDEDRDSPATISELAETAMIAPSSMSRVVDGMVRNDLVARVADSSDRRIHHVVPTAGGREILERVSAINEAAAPDVMSALAPDDCRQWIRITNDIADVIESIVNRRR